MSGPKRWVSSKVHRKANSKSSLSSVGSSPSLSTEGGMPPSPPIHLPNGGVVGGGTDATTAATTIVDFGSGSTLITQRSGSGGSSSADIHGFGLGGGGTTGGGGGSSIDSSSTGLTQSPSSTPPKKTWEKNYTSFLKKKMTGGSSKLGPIKTSLPRIQHHNNSHTTTASASPRTQSVENATTLLSKAVHHQPLFLSSSNKNNNNNDLGGGEKGLADGFADHSARHCKTKSTSSSSQASSSSCSTSEINRRRTFSDNRLSHNFISGGGSGAPPSPTRQYHHSTKKSSFIKRVMSKSSNKSVDDLDTSLRRGNNRTTNTNSPNNTPPSSVPSTPIQQKSSYSPLGNSPGIYTTTTTTFQDGLEKASMLSSLLYPPPLAPDMNTTSSTTTRVVGGNNNNNNNSSPKTRLSSPKHHHRKGSSQVNLIHDENNNSLDQARHRGNSVSISSSSCANPIPSLKTATLQSQSAVHLPTSFSRVQSMGSNLVIPEGKPAVISNNNNNENRDNCFTPEDEQLLAREKRKAFTDFHNMGVDSSSAYLGDDSSLHKNSVFLSSMAYPAGSAGGKAHSRHAYSQHGGGAHSFDPKRNISPSTSMSSISETKPQHAAEADDADFSPERALRSLRGPEHWTKGERHAIIPGVLSMCPIQVLNNIMSKEEEGSSNSSMRASLTSRGSQRGFGIGSMISEDEGVDSNGWFFADHHQPTSSGGGVGGALSRPTSANVLLPPSNFGKIVLGKATVAPLGMRSFLNEVYGWCTGVFLLRQNYLFEYREGDSLNGLPWGYAHLPLAEAYPHKHFTNALHLDFFERPCTKSGKRSLLLRVESKGERDRWVSLLQSAARLTMHDLYDVDESDGAPEFGHGRYAVVRPAKRRQQRQRTMSISDTRYPPVTSSSQENFRNVSSYDSLGGCNKSSNDLEGGVSLEYDCALKIIDKKEFWSRVKKGRERADTLVREASIQTTLAVQGTDAPGFLRLRNIFETGEKLVLELELLKGTDLFQHVSSRGVLDEVEAAHIMRDLLECLSVLDQVGVAHRDIKPANLLMCHNENNHGPRIKLADYGMASFVGVDNLVRGRCGTPGFVAPEILLTAVNGGYGNKVDIFSAGVTLYVMLAGYEPFYGESDAELIDANRKAKVDFPRAEWHNVSLEGRDLIERMLVVDPAKRIGPREALRHPWITRRATAQTNESCSHEALCSIF